MFTSCKVHKPSNHKMTSSICFEQDLARQTSPIRNRCSTECFHSNSTNWSCPQDRGWHTPVNSYHSVSVKKQRQGPVTQCHWRRQRQVTTVTQCHQNDKGHWPVTQCHQNDKGHWPVTQCDQSDKGQSQSVTKMTKATGQSHSVTKVTMASRKVSPKWQRPLASHSSHTLLPKRQQPVTQCQRPVTAVTQCHCQWRWHIVSLKNIKASQMSPSVNEEDKDKLQHHRRRQMPVMDKPSVNKRRQRPVKAVTQRQWRRQKKPVTDVPRVNKEDKDQSQKSQCQLR